MTQITVPNVEASPLIQLRQSPEILKFFAYSHLPPHLQLLSKSFHDLAMEMVAKNPPSAEQAMGLRKLLEAKDCFVRASLP